MFGYLFLLYKALLQLQTRPYTLNFWKALWLIWKIQLEPTQFNAKIVFLKISAFNVCTCALQLQHRKALVPSLLTSRKEEPRE